VAILLGIPHLSTAWARQVHQSQRGLALFSPSRIAGEKKKTPPKVGTGATKNFYFTPSLGSFWLLFSSLPSPSLNLSSRVPFSYIFILSSFVVNFFLSSHSSK
jgi:hypothetical protein